MVKRFVESDVNKSALVDLRLAMIGYGSQGRGQALNLRDSGIDVRVGLREGGPSWKAAQADGWEPQRIEDACRQADLIALMVPDMAQPGLFRELVQPNLKPAATLLFAHGFSVHFKLIEVPSEYNVIMVAPKGPGATVRKLYQAGSGVAALIAIHQNADGGAMGRAQELALAYAWAIGSARTGIMETTFGEECETDLFSEQAILCGGLPELILAGWETLVEAGYQPEIAYFECLHEVKLIADLLYEGGLKKMYDLISDTAAYGGLVNGSRVISQPSRDAMRAILAEVRSGKFARQWRDTATESLDSLREMVASKQAHPIESVGQSVRDQFLS